MNNVIKLAYLYNTVKKKEKRVVDSYSSLQRSAFPLACIFDHFFVKSWRSYYQEFATGSYETS